VEIAMIKVVVPNMTQRVVDWAIQAHGGAGLSSDFPLAQMFAGARTLRIVDGPDEVHRQTIARLELANSSVKHHESTARRPCRYMSGTTSFANKP
jgi:acyl-CoA dehydrogenase